MLFNITYACYALWIYYKVWVIATVIICKIIQATYLKVTGYDKWGLGWVPLTHLYYKRELAAVPIYLLIPYGIFIVLSTIYPDYVTLVPLIIFACVCNYKFAVMYVDQYSAPVYAFVPFAKYIIMVKDILSLTNLLPNRR